MKQKWTEKPAAWGGGIMLRIVCYLISIVGCACYYIAWFRPAWVTKLKDTVKCRFRKIIHEE